MKTILPVEPNFVFNINLVVLPKVRLNLNLIACKSSDSSA